MLNNLLIASYLPSSWWPDATWNPDRPPVFVTGYVGPIEQGLLPLATWPDAFVRLAAEQHLHFAANVQPLPQVNVTPPWWPDRFAPTRPIQQPFAYVTPERTSPLASAWWPNAVARPIPQEQQAFAANVVPERTFTLVTAWWPDAVIRFVTQQQLYFAANVQPLPQVNVTPPWWPDRFAPARPIQQPFAYVTPERTSPLASAWWPDAVARPSAQNQQAFAANVAPERTFTLTTAWWPDRFAPTWPIQQPFAYVTPERTTPLASAWWPDAVARPSAQNQQAFAANVAPERTFTIASAWWPDRFAPTCPIQQPFAYVTPERTTLLASAWWPDVVARPTPQEQQAFVANVAPERTFTLATAWWPDRFAPTWPVQQPFAYVTPERTTPLASAWWPDAVARPTAQNQQAFAANVAPERTFTIATAWWPDRFAPTWPVQQPFAYVTPERTTPLASAWWPDAVARPSAQNQQAFAANVAPERTFTLATTWWPDRFAPTWPVQQPFAYVTPERTSSLASAWWPDAVARPTPQEQQAFAANIAFEETSQLTSAWWPDSILKPFVQEQLAFATGTSPEGKSALDWNGWHPDLLGRVEFAASNQIAVTLVGVPERTLPAFVGWFPDTIDRVAQNVGWVFSVPIQPERTSALVLMVFPDSIARPAFRALSGETPIPFFESSKPPPLPVYPDAFTRREYDASEQLAFQIPPFIPPTPPPPPPPTSPIVINVGGHGGGSSTVNWPCPDGWEWVAVWSEDRTNYRFVCQPIEKEKSHEPISLLPIPETIVLDLEALREKKRRERTEHVQRVAMNIQNARNQTVYVPVPVEQNALSTMAWVGLGAVVSLWARALIKKS